NPAGCQRRRDCVEALPRREHVEDDAVDGTRLGVLWQGILQVAHVNGPVTRCFSDERLDVCVRDLGELLTSFERLEGTICSNRTKQPQGESARANPRLHNTSTGEDVGLGEDLRG